MESKNFIHEHPLVLKEEWKKDGKRVLCYGCRKQILSPPVYFCSECNIFLHNACAKLPLQITHPLHSEHILLLINAGVVDINTVDALQKYMQKNEGLPKVNRNCYSCQVATYEGFSYRCSPCNFDICVVCSVSTDQGIITHDSHQHPLRFVPRPASFRCDACVDDIDDSSYVCNTCSFWIHQQCAMLPIEKQSDFHVHPLSLSYGVPPEFRPYQLNCDTCNQTLEPLRWVYFCGRCRFFMHINCWKFSNKRSHNLRSSSHAKQEGNLIKLPWKDMSVEVIKPFIARKSQIEMQPSEQIKHFSHEHPLILSTTQIENQKDNEEVLCDGCVESISGPHYSCSQCGYLMHIHCALLPTELQHKNHPEHPLFLKKLNHELGYFYCKICHATSNGFFFECETCDFQADLSCAVLPMTITHEAHNEHPLVQRVISHRSFLDGPCSACGKNLSGLVYCCGEYCLGFYLHYQCATLPRAIRHRWDKHQLILTYPPFSDHDQNELFCEVCEEEIHPKHWLYCCHECDQTFHPFCISQLGKDRHVKFGHTIRVHDHQHLLVSVRESRFKSECARCGNNLSNNKAFECGTCRFSLCYKCVCSNINIPREPSESGGILPGQEEETVKSFPGCMIM